jgi:hypothetical protein
MPIAELRHGERGDHTTPVSGESSGHLADDPFAERAIRRRERAAQKRYVVLQCIIHTGRKINGRAAIH